MTRDFGGKEAKISYKGPRFCPLSIMFSYPLKALAYRSREITFISKLPDHNSQKYREKSRFLTHVFHAQNISNET